MTADTPGARLSLRALAWLLDLVPFVAAAVWAHEATGVWHAVRQAWQFVRDTYTSIRQGAPVPPALDPGVLTDLWLFLLLMLAVNVAWAAYRICALVVFGATVGKWLLRLRVVSVLDGGRPTWSQAWLRWAVPQGMALLPLPGTGLLPYAMVLRDRTSRRGGHDRISGTQVVGRG